MWIPEAERAFSIELPGKLINLYLEELYQFFMNPREEYLLGAVCLLRQLEGCIYDQTKQALKQSFTAPSFRNTRETLETCYGELSSMLHYQGFKGCDPASERTAEKEMQFLSADAASAAPGSVLLRAARILTGFLMDLGQEEISGLEYLQRTAEFLQQKHDGRLVKIERFGLKTDAGVQPGDRFISGLSRILFLLHAESCRGKKKEISRIQVLSAAVAARLMAEKAGHILSWKHLPDPGSEEGQKAPSGKMKVPMLRTGSIPEDAAWELEDYLVFLKGVHGFKENIELYEGVSGMEDLQRECNRLIDYRWSEGKKSAPKDRQQHLEKTVETELLKYTDEGGEREKIRRINVRAVMLSDIIVEESLPVSLKKLREEYRADVHKLRRKCRIHQVLNRILIPAAALLTVLMVALAIVFVPKTATYADYVFERGLPKGIQRLTQAHPDTACYRIVTQAGRFLSLEHLNAAGRLTDENQDIYPDRPARFSMDFDNQSVLNAYNAAGEPLYQAVISEDGKSITFRHPDTGDELLLPYDSTQMNVYRWAEQSRDVETSTASGMFALRASAFTSGRPGIISFEQADERHADGNGVELIRLDYDELGRVIQLEYEYTDFGEDLFEQLLESNTRAKTLAADRLIRRTCTYSDTHPWMDSCLDEFADGTYLRRAYTYEKGNCTEILLQGTHGKSLSASPGGMRMLFAYEEGRMTERSFTDLAGRAINGADGYAKQTWVYEGDRMVRSSRTLADGRPFPYGWAVMESHVDGQGTETTAYFDAEGRSVRGDYEWSRMVSETDEPYNRGWKARILTYYDANDAMMLQTCGARKVRMEISPDGQTQIGHCLNAEGQIEAGSEGYAAWITRKNGSLVLSREYIGMHEEAVNCREGYSRVEYEYNAKRQNTVTKYTSVTGLHKNGYDRITRQYQQQGRIEGIVSTLHVDGKDVPVINPETGAAYVTYVYEEDSSKRVACFNAEKKPMVSPVYGCAAIETIYDAQGRVTEERYLDENGQPMLNEKKQMVLQKFTYDDPGLMKTIFQLLKTDQTAEAGPVWKKVQIDQRGRTARWTYLDAQMQPVEDAGSGIAGEIHEESDDGRTLRITYIGTGGQTVTHGTQGYASVLFEYDAVGNLRKWVYCDEDGRPVLSPGRGYAGVAEEYDQENRLTAWTYLDEQLQPMELAAEGYATVRREYDENGYISAEWYEDRNGLPAVGASNRYAKVTWDRNRDGNPKVTRFYSSDGSLTAPPQYGYAVEMIRYDSIGRIARIEYFDASGHTAQNAEGQYGEEREYYNPAKPEEYYISYLKENGQAYSEEEGAEDRIQGYIDSWYQIPMFYDYDGPVRQEGINWADPETHAFDEELGAAGAKVVAETDGVSVYPVLVEFVDSNGQIIFNQVRGWAGKELGMTVVDGYSYLSRTRYYDAQGQLTIVPELGAAGMDLDPLNQDQYSRMTYIGTDGLPMINALEGFCTVRYAFDGNTILSESYYDEKDQPMCCPEGFARYLFETKEDNGITERTVRYFDEKGNPVNTKDGRAAKSVILTYEDQHYQEITNYGPDDQLTVNTVLGFAKMIVRGRKQGQQEITEVEYYNEQGVLDIPKGQGPLVDYARVVTKTETGANGDRVSVMEYYGTNGVPIISIERNAFRAETIQGIGKYELRLYGLDGQLINNASGIAVYKRIEQPIPHYEIYDADNVEILHHPGWIQYIADNTAVAQKGTFAEAKPGNVFLLTTTMDSDERPVRSEFSDVTEHAVISPEVGCAVIEQAYNGYGLTHIGYVDEYGEPYVNPVAGCAGIRVTWNSEKALSGLYYEYTDGTIMNNTNCDFAYLQMTENGDYMAYDVQGRPVRLIEKGEKVPFVWHGDSWRIMLEAQVGTGRIQSSKTYLIQ